MGERDARPEDFVGKTIVSVDVESANIWRFEFEGGTRIAIEADMFHTSAGDIPILQICEVCARPPTDISLIRTGDLIEAMEAAKRIVLYDAIEPTLILELVAMAQDKAGRLSSRQASIYTLGWVDRDGITEPTLRVIARDKDEPAEIREHAEEALYYFAQVRRRNRADRSPRRRYGRSYADQSFDEWRASQTDLPQ